MEQLAASKNSDKEADDVDDDDDILVAIQRQDLQYLHQVTQENQNILINNDEYKARLFYSWPCISDIILDRDHVHLDHNTLEVREQVIDHIQKHNKWKQYRQFIYDQLKSINNDETTMNNQENQANNDENNVSKFINQIGNKFIHKLFANLDEMRMDVVEKLYLLHSLGFDIKTKQEYIVTLRDNIGKAENPERISNPFQDTPQYTNDKADDKENDKNAYNPIIDYTKIKQWYNKWSEIIPGVGLFLEMVLNIIDAAIEDDEKLKNKVDINEFYQKNGLKRRSFSEIINDPRFDVNADYVFGGQIYNRFSAFWHILKYGTTDMLKIFLKHPKLRINDNVRYEYGYMGSFVKHNALFTVFCDPWKGFGVSSKMSEFDELQCLELILNQQNIDLGYATQTGNLFLNGDQQYLNETLIWSHVLQHGYPLHYYCCLKYYLIDHYFLETFLKVFEQSAQKHLEKYAQNNNEGHNQDVCTRYYEALIGNNYAGKNNIFSNNKDDKSIFKFAWHVNVDCGHYRPHRKCVKAVPLIPFPERLVIFIDLLYEYVFSDNKVIRFELFDELLTFISIFDLLVSYSKESELCHRKRFKDKDFEGDRSKERRVCLYDDGSPCCIQQSEIFLEMFDYHLSKTGRFILL